MIRRLVPDLIAHQILGVQPMAPTAEDFASIFSVKYTFTDPNIKKFHKRYKFSRAKWHYCHFGHGQFSRVYQWCTDNFGEESRGGDAWMRWKAEGDKVRFLNEDDAIMFKLKWI